MFPDRYCPAFPNSVKLRLSEDNITSRKYLPRSWETEAVHGDNEHVGYLKPLTISNITRWIARSTKAKLQYLDEDRIIGKAFAVGILKQISDGIDVLS
jgi:hypothetical protein